MKFNYKYSKSFNFQYSLEPLGKGLLIMKGIFFSSSSFSAMVKPSIILLGTSINGSAPLLICFALKPITRAFSNFVK